jgi:DNA-binding NarL/FixJ family response regulator
MGLFGLTSAEAAIAIALASGEAAEEIAARRRRSQATVRTQIRAVLRKTDCASVLDMAMLLTRLRA